MLITSHKIHIIAFVILVFFGNAQAAVIDFIDNGNYTTDTISGLDWIDVTLTAGLSYNDVSSQLVEGSNYDGWRYATGGEFINMVTNYTDVPNPDETFIFYPGTTFMIDLQGLLGYTLETEYATVTRGKLSDWDNGHMFADLYNAKNDDYQYSQPHAGGTGDSHANIVIGSYLVRSTTSPVPEPSAFWLFSFGLIGIFGFMKRCGEINHR